MVEKRFEICPAAELQPGERRIVTLDGFSVGVFNVDGEYYAMKNDCPHQRAPLCEGKWTGITTSSKPGEYNWERDGEIIQCPWHGWEFDITTGESVFNPHSVKVKTFEAAVENGSDDPAESGAKDVSQATDGGCSNCEADLQGEKPPVETYDVAIESGTVVVYT